MRERQNRGAHFDTLVDMFMVWMRNDNYELDELIMAAYLADGISKEQAKEDEEKKA